MKTILIAAVFSLLGSILVTPLVVAFFRRRGFGQEIRTDGPQRHLIKRGTPTMGGVAIVGSTVFGYGVAHVIVAIRGGGGPTASGLLALYLMVGLGTVGFLDDFIKIRRQRNLGLRARAKFGGQLVVGLSFAVLALQFRNRLGLTPASKHLSYVRDIGAISLGSLGFVLVAYLIIAATSNAVNLTDGLDGLAAGAASMVFGAFTLILFLQYRNPCGTNPIGGCYVVRDPLDLALVAASALSACFGFLWWNASPAQIFMGDTGSMALGGLMAGLAILSRTELLLGRAGRPVRGRHAVRHHPDGLVQAHPAPTRHRPAGVPDGPAAPSLRARRLGRDHDHRAVLDPRRDRRRVRDGAVLRRLHQQWLTRCRRPGRRCWCAARGLPGPRRSGRSCSAAIAC